MGGFIEYGDILQFQAPSIYTRLLVHVMQYIAATDQLSGQQWESLVAEGAACSCLTRRRSGGCSGPSGRAAAGWHPGQTAADHQTPGHVAGP